MTKIEVALTILRTSAAAGTSWSAKFMFHHAPAALLNHGATNAQFRERRLFFRADALTSWKRTACVEREAASSEPPNGQAPVPAIGRGSREKGVACSRWANWNSLRRGCLRGCRGGRRTVASQ